MQETRFWSLDREDPLQKGMATHSSSLAREFRGQSSLVGYSPRGHRESDMTEWLTGKYTELLNMNYSRDLFSRPLFTIPKTELYDVTIYRGILVY